MQSTCGSSLSGFRHAQHFSIASYSGLVAWVSFRPRSSHGALMTRKTILSAGSFLQGGPQNGYGYRNADVTSLTADITKETDEGRRLAMLREVEKIALTDAVVIPRLILLVSSTVGCPRTCRVCLRR